MTGSPFLNTIRQDLRQKGYALKTEKTYIHWIKRFILFHQKRQPVTMGDEEVRLFLSYLANNHHVAVNTQKTALPYTFFTGRARYSYCARITRS